MQVKTTSLPSNDEILSGADCTTKRTAEKYHIIKKQYRVTLPYTFKNEILSIVCR